MVTMSDIAKEAGVSRLTVSVILSGRESAVKISLATKERVLAIAKRMNYRPNALASAIRKGSTNILGVIGVFNGGYGLEMINGIVEAADEMGFSCKFRFTGSGKTVADDIGACLEYRVCGIICRTGDSKALSDIRTELEREKVPLVLLDSSASAPGCSLVNSDDIEGGRQAAQYLLVNGFRHILYACNGGRKKQPFAEWRFNGFEAGLGRRLAPYEMICYEHNRSMDEAENAHVAERIRAFNPDAVFCDNDYIALKTLTILNMLGLKVPEDISIMGFGGLDFSALTYPALTTIRQPFFDMGRTSVVELKNLLSGGIVREMRLKTELVTRNSVKKRT